MTRTEIKAAADTARENASAAYDVWNNARRAYGSWASQENRKAMIAAEVPYKYACKDRARAEYNEMALSRGWTLR